MIRPPSVCLVAVRLLVAAWLLAGVVLQTAPPVAADAVDDGVRRIARQLRCPICESVSVADSPAELAGQMRALIRKKLEAGESDQQIIDYFVAAYGESVLLEPPRRGLGWAVWLGPLVALGAGALLLWLVLRVWVRPRTRSGRPHTRATVYERQAAEFEARAREELEAIREGGSR